MSQSSSVFFFICVALLIKDFSDCCSDSELVRGCRLATSEVTGTFECLCGAGCEKEFPFKSRTECETVLKGMLCASHLILLIKYFTSNFCSM